MICCDNQIIESIDGYPTCVECGQVNVYQVDYVIDRFNTNGNYKYNSQIMYIRSNYFKIILKNLNGDFVDSYIDSQLKSIATTLKAKNIQDLFKIKKYMKLNNLNKYIKYIYRIYYFAYGIKLIDLSENQIQMIVDDFHTFNKKYVSTVKKRNQLNYNFIISKLFENRNIDNKNILLPASANRLNKIYNDIYI